MQLLMLLTQLAIRAATLQEDHRKGQQSLGLRGQGGPRVATGVSHRAELNLSLCGAVFSPAGMPASTPEAGYCLPKHSSRGRQGLAALAKFWLNLRAHGVGERDIDSA